MTPERLREREGRGMSRADWITAGVKRDYARSLCLRGRVCWRVPRSMARESKRLAEWGPRRRGVVTRGPGKSIRPLCPITMHLCWARQLR